MAVAQRLDLDRFNQVGYLVVEDVLDPESDLVPVIQEYGQLLDDLSTRWKSEGKLPETFADLPFPQRFARIEQEAKDLNVMSHFDISAGQGRHQTDADPPWSGGVRPSKQSPPAGRRRADRRAGNLLQPDSARPHQATRTRGSRGTA